MKGEQKQKQQNEQSQQQLKQDSIYGSASLYYARQEFLRPPAANDTSGRSQPQSEQQVARDFWRHKQHPRQEVAKSGAHPAEGNQNGSSYYQQQIYNSYPIYNDDEDVWCSEESLFEHHLEEIINKWRLLDDDIWCKLIIMERNRRIGKAYARVPIVTIDGSPELSYDGYKLALNGFDNPHRDLKTEECRKRIGKGIRIKMDNFGNILIKRLTKSGVFIKGWINQFPAQSQKFNRNVMPSRQQLIKNHCSQNGIYNKISTTPSFSNTSIIYASNNNHGPLSPGPDCGDVNPSEMMMLSSSASSSNDSSICDEIINICGRLEQDKIYVIFDMKKFQANISQELCYPYPDKRKLERQCFSIIGLVRDASDILSLPCWVMVINIVAIEMLNERFSQATSGMQTSFPDTAMLHLSSLDVNRRMKPSSKDYTTIYSNNSSSSSGINTDSNNTSSNLKSLSRSDKNINGRHEDPYTMPANASSSDFKSSTDDYITSLGKSKTSGSSSDMHKSVGINASYRALDTLNRDGPSSWLRNTLASETKRRSRSSCNVRGSNQMLNGAGCGTNLGRSRHDKSQQHRGGSIYSPGHMLLQTASGNIPPKLPPRDFSSNRTSAPTKLSNTIHGNNSLEEPTKTAQNFKTKSTSKLVDPTMAPEKTRSSQNRSNSVVGNISVGRYVPTYLPAGTNAENHKPDGGCNTTTGSGKLTTKASSNSGLKHLRSLLSSSSSGNSSGGSSSKNNNAAINNTKNIGKSTAKVCDDSVGYIHVDNDDDDDDVGGNKQQHTTSYAEEEEADSVVDSTELLDDAPACCRVGASSGGWSTATDCYNGLDIPTPDYEFDDENIYAPGHDSNTYRGFSTMSASNNNNNNGPTIQHPTHFPSDSVRGRTSVHRRSNKDDLYHSGFRAHVSQSVGTSGRSNKTEKGLIAEGKELARQPHRSDSCAGINDRLTSVGGRTSLYNSSTIGTARYRSMSMQRYQTRPPIDHDAGEDIYNLDQPVFSQYGTSRKTLAGRPRNRDALSCTRAGNQAQFASNPKILNTNSYHTIGRSSSGIYNSSSSSSDYVDWNPQMRKFNSSGYLNSIFRSNQQNTLPTNQRQNSVRTIVSTFNNNMTHHADDVKNHRKTMSFENYAKSLRSREPRGKHNRNSTSSTLLRRSSQLMANPLDTYQSSFDRASKEELSKSSFITPSRWLMT